MYKDSEFFCFTTFFADFFLRREGHKKNSLYKRENFSYLLQLLQSR